MIRAGSRELLAAAALTGLAAFLLLWRLDVPLLWQDEAETANIAVNLLDRGYPTPWDGSHLVTQQGGRDSLHLGEHQVWAWHPWPQHYLAAAGMRLFGHGTAPARLPFALIALVSVPLFFAWRVGRDRLPTAIVATAIYSLAPAFFLFSRQSRYYALLFLGGVWALQAYQAQAARAGRANGVGPAAHRHWVGLAAALALLFYGNPLTGLAFAAGLGIHALVSAHPLRPLARSLALFAVLAAPWLVLVVVSDVRTPELGAAERGALLASQLWRLQYCLLPLVLWPPLGWLWWRSRSPGSEKAPQDGIRQGLTTNRSGGLSRELELLAILVIVNWLLVVLLAPMGSARYALPIWPLAASALALLWQAIAERSAAVGVLFLGLLLLTDLFPSLPAFPLAVARPDSTSYDREAPTLDKLAFGGRVNSPLTLHLGQLARRECGPTAAIVALGGALERAPRLIATGYGWESLHFYLRAPAVDFSGQRAARNRLGLPPVAADLSAADLIVPRRGWPPPSFDPSLHPELVAVDLGIPDDTYENLPDPNAHRYSPTPPDALPPLVVWVRRELLPPAGLGAIHAPGCAPLHLPASPR